jgi:hypothetical protein
MSWFQCNRAGPGRKGGFVKGDGKMTGLQGEDAAKSNDAESRGGAQGVQQREARDNMSAAQDQPNAGCPYPSRGIGQRVRQQHCQLCT